MKDFGAKEFWWEMGVQLMSSSITFSKRAGEGVSIQADSGAVTLGPKCFRDLFKKF